MFAGRRGLLNKWMSNAPRTEVLSIEQRLTY